MSDPPAGRGRGQATQSLRCVEALLTEGRPWRSSGSTATRVRDAGVRRAVERRQAEPGNRSILREVAEEFEVGEQSLRIWVKRLDDGMFSAGEAARLRQAPRERRRTSGGRRSSPPPVTSPRSRAWPGSAW